MFLRHRGRVPYKGPIVNIIHQLMGGLRSSMGYLGCADIAEMHEKAEFVEITSAGMNRIPTSMMYRLRKRRRTITADLFITKASEKQFSDGLLEIFAVYGGKTGHFQPDTPLPVSENPPPYRYSIIFAVFTVKHSFISRRNGIIQTM